MLQPQTRRAKAGAPPKFLGNALLIGMKRAHFERTLNRQVVSGYRHALIAKAGDFLFSLHGSANREGVGREVVDIKSIIFEPKAEVEITKADLAQLFVSAEHHYDDVCRQLANKGGLLWGTRNMLDKDEMVIQTLSSRDLNILCKVSESPACGIDLHLKLCAIFAKIRSERERINNGAHAE
jgi:hypothetical protein